MPNINDLAQLIGITPDDEDPYEPSTSDLEDIEHNEEIPPSVLYISPDDLWARPNLNTGTTFTYGPKSKLTTAPGGITHKELLYDNVYNYNNNNPDADDEIEEMLEILNTEQEYHTYLYGRIEQASQESISRKLTYNFSDHQKQIQKLIDEEAYIISFWNMDEKAYENYYSQCMKALYSEGHIREPAYVSTPINGIVTYSAHPERPTAKGGRTAIDPAYYKLQKDLHQLHGDEKKEAMRKLGLGFKGKKQGWQKTMQDTGIIGPGQKWWAQHSESTFAKSLNTILENIRCQHQPPTN